MGVGSCPASLFEGDGEEGEGEDGGDGAEEGGVAIGAGEGEGEGVSLLLLVGLSLFTGWFVSGGLELGEGGAGADGLLLSLLPSNPWIRSACMI